MPQNAYLRIKIKEKKHEDSDNISQGQKQLLTIARAFLADKKLLILDEATGALDSQTTIYIEKNIELMKDVTCISVTHKLDESILRRYDQILLIHSGEIKESGTYDDYAAWYRAMFNTDPPVNP